jgi:chromosome segregation ATPase
MGVGRFWCVVLSLFLAACSDRPSREDLEARIEELEGQNAALQKRLESAEASAQQAAAAVQNVKNEAERFGSEDWSDVVGDVQDAANEAEYQADEAVNQF